MKVIKGQIVDGYIFQGGDVKDQKNWKPVLPTMGESMKDEVASRGGWDKFWGGVGAKMDSYAYGAKGLFTDLPKEEQERVDLGKETRKTLPGAIGGAAVDVAATYPLFGTLTAQTARMGPLARDLTQIGGAGAIGGGAGAISNPGDRAGGAVREGLGAATGMGIAQGARGVWAPGMGSTADALQARGVRLTPGQSAGGFVKSVEDANRAINPSVGRRQGEAIADWNKTMLDDVSPTKVSGPGHEGMAEAQRAFGKAYDAAGTKILQGDGAYGQSLDDLVAVSKPYLTPDEAKVLADQISVAKQLAAGQKNTSAFRTFENSLSGKINDAKTSNQPMLAEAYSLLRQHMGSLRDRSGASTPQLDKDYAKFSRMKEASSMKGAMDDGVFSPDQLKSRVRAAGETGQLSRGDALLQKEAAEAAGVLGPTIPPVGPGTAEKLMLAGGLPSGIGYALATGNWAPLAVGAGLFGANKLAYSPLGMNMLVGNNPMQRAIGPEWQAALAASGGALADPALSRKRR
jgi:hypothetical protein